MKIRASWSSTILKYTVLVAGLIVGGSALADPPTTVNVFEVSGHSKDAIATATGFVGSLEGAGFLNSEFTCTTTSFDDQLIPGIIVLALACDLESDKGAFKTIINLLMVNDGSGRYSNVNVIQPGSGTGQYAGMTGYFHFFGYSPDLADGLQPGDRFPSEMKGQISLPKRKEK